MTDKKKKITVSEMIDKGEKVGDAVKEFTPREVDNVIDRGTQAARLANQLKKVFGGLWGKKSIF
jgi:hypothetical protein